MPCVSAPHPGWLLARMWPILCYSIIINAMSVAVGCPMAWELFRYALPTQLG